MVHFFRTSFLVRCFFFCIWYHLPEYVESNLWSWRVFTGFIPSVFWKRDLWVHCLLFTTSRFTENEIYLDLGKVSTKVIVSGPTITTSKFGKPIIQIGKYRYYQRANYKGPQKNWVCSKYRSSNCRAAVTTYNDKIIYTKSGHNH